MRIDWWTLALQTVNVLILIWILARFFFRPVMDIVVKRQQEVNKLLTDAADARQKAADACADADKARARDCCGTGKTNGGGAGCSADRKAESDRTSVPGDRQAPWRSGCGDRPRPGGGRRGDHRSRHRAIDRDRAAPACAFSASGHALRIHRGDLPRGARIVTCSA